VEPKRPSLPYSPAIERVMAYMARNLDRRLPLAELAGAAMVRTPTHFCAQFRREVGITPAVYHMRLRLEAAREALRRPQAEITRVAMQFGFSSSQHFSDLFRRTYEMTPREWKLGS
jgi:transcriptional regulator GlxA family with amidase domain